MHITLCTSYYLTTYVIIAIHVNYYFSRNYEFLMNFKNSAIRLKNSRGEHWLVIFEGVNFFTKVYKFLVCMVS